MSYSTSNRGSGGGGGGFGSFPYRSSHQSGSDYPGGRGGGGGGGRKKRSSKSKYLKRKQHGGPLLYTALLSVPSLKRSLIVGHAGKVIKDICQRTKCVMDVPAARASGGGPDPAAGSSNDNSSTGTTDSTATNNNSEIAAEGSRRERRNGNNALARVKIRASCVEYLLFACWEVSLVIQEDVEYQINIQQPQQHQHQQGKYRTSTSTSTTSPLITILRGIMRYLPSNLMSSTSSSCNRQDGNAIAEQYSPTCTNDSLSPCNNYNNYSAGLFLEDTMHSVVAPTDDTTTSNRDGTIDSIHPIMIMSCYVIPSYLLDEDEMEVLVDNERFCDPDIKAHAFTVTRTREKQQQDGSQEKAFVGSGEVSSHRNLTLLFIYGSPNDKTWNLYHNIHKHVRKLEEEEER